MTALELLLAAVAVAVGATIQGSIGFGLNLVAAPVLALVDPRLVPGPALVAALVMTILLAARERRSVDVAGVRWALLGRVPGTLAGAAVVALLSPRALGLAFGVLVLLGVALSASRVRLGPTPGTLVGAGVLSGLMGTATSIGGPPMALVYQHSAGAVLRGTLSVFFIVGSVLSMAVLAAVGELGRSELVASAVLVPPVLVGFWASRWIAPHLDQGRTRTAVLAISTAAAVAVILREL